MYKPMLAATLEWPEQLIFPVIVSPKLDGYRCVIRDGVAYTRSLKPFRNEYVQSKIGQHGFNGLDGELIVGSPTEGLVLNRSSAVMATAGAPEFTFFIFDCFDRPYDPFVRRLESLNGFTNEHIRKVPHIMAENIDEFLAYEREFLELGYEGIMIRSPHGQYKYGRSTLPQGDLIKFKRFTDGEAVVIEILEGQHNNNEFKRDALGQALRATHKENMLPAGKVGAMICRDLKTGEVLQISAGRMIHTDREFYFNNPTKLLGSVIKYKTFQYGRVDAPRFSTYQAHRDRDDL